MYRKGDNVYYTPDELGYKDRGMVKWQGFILSDHMEQMLIEEKQYRYSPHQSALSQEECASRLSQAYQHKRQVTLQLATLAHGHHHEEMTGYTKGVEDGQLYFQTQTGMRVIPLELISHVHLNDNHKWFTKDSES